jgi:hypothetical protein
MIPRPSPLAATIPQAQPSMLGTSRLLSILLLTVLTSPFRRSPQKSYVEAESEADDEAEKVVKAEKDDDFGTAFDHGVGVSTNGGGDDAMSDISNFDSEAMS